MTEIYLILPNIRSCHNVGALFRTADACGVSKLILAGYTATPPKPQIDKVSLGAEQWIPFEHLSMSALPSYIEKLKIDGFRIIALEQTADSIVLGEANLSGSLALIVGNEVEGVGPELLALADQVVHIPMYGRKESLNVSVAGGIALYEVARSRKP